MPDVLEEVRRRCEAVAQAAEMVRIDLACLKGYAEALPRDRLALPEMDPLIHFVGHGRESVAFFLTLDAVNFGSGYFPEILNDARVSGFRTVAAALTRYFSDHGPIPAEELRALTPKRCAGIFGFDCAAPLAAELMTRFATALNDLGRFVCDRFEGDFVRLVAAAEGSAQRLVEILRQMPLYDDTATFRGGTVPFLKRAQLTAVDLFIAFRGEGPGRFDDLDRITICADNLVPHVLRLDGVLLYREDLAAQIDAGALLPAGCEAEVEIRACAVHAGELLVAELRRKGTPANALLLDNLLWHRGQEPRYREHPRHRTRTPFY